MQSSSSEPSRLLQLPKELRLEIFKYANLIDNRYDHARHEAIFLTENQIFKISDSRLCRRYPSCRSCEYCEPQPDRIERSLLIVNRQVHDEALEILLGHNRIILQNGHEKNLECLQALPQNIYKRLRRLHIRFSREHDFVLGKEAGPCCVISNPHSWDKLISWIAANLTLSILHLSIDLGEGFYSLYVADPVDVVFCMRAFQRVSLPLPKLRGLKDCFVFLPLKFRMEAQMERAATGNPAYSSIERNKVPPIERCCRLPHSWPPLGRYDAANSSFIHNWGMLDVAEDAKIRSPAYAAVEERGSSCLHKEWWVGLPVPKLA